MTTPEKKPTGTRAFVKPSGKKTGSATGGFEPPTAAHRRPNTAAGRGSSRADAGSATGAQAAVGAKPGTGMYRVPEGASSGAKAALLAQAKKDQARAEAASKQKRSWQLLVIAAAAVVVLGYLGWVAVVAVVYADYRQPLAMTWRDGQGNLALADSARQSLLLVFGDHRSAQASQLSPIPGQPQRWRLGDVHDDQFRDATPPGAMRGHGRVPSLEWGSSSLVMITAHGEVLYLPLSAEVFLKLDAALRRLPTATDQADAAAGRAALIEMLHEHGLDEAVPVLENDAQGAGDGVVAPPDSAADESASDSG